MASAGGWVSQPVFMFLKGQGRLWPWGNMCICPHFSKMLSLALETQWDLHVKVSCACPGSVHVGAMMAPWPACSVHVGGFEGRQ